MVIIKTIVIMVIDIIIMINYDLLNDNGDDNMTKMATRTILAQRMSNHSATVPIMPRSIIT